MFMPVSLPRVDFKQIRPHGHSASQEDGFEELASVLFKQIVDPPSDVVFDRFGNPDAGREGKATFPNGDVWAWQAKFVFKFEASEANQIKKSFQRAIQIEPNLKKYLVILPINLSAGDGDGIKSAHSKWLQYVSEWQDLARQKGLEVEIELVNESKLIELLTRPENSGRLLYWFSRDTFTIDEQRQRIEDTVAKVQSRYQPDVHVDLRIQDDLEAVGGTAPYFARWRQHLINLRNLRVDTWSLPSQFNASHEDRFKRFVAAIKSFDATLVRLIDGAPFIKDPSVLASELPDHNDAAEILSALPSELRGVLVSPEGTLINQLHSALRAIHSVRRFIHSSATQAAYSSELLIIGKAGVGKTHLLCEMSRKRISTGLPTLCLLGQDFSSQNLLPQIPVNAEIDGKVDEVLSLLDAAGEASNSKALLIIDAINESEDPSKWPSTIASLQSKIHRFKHVGLVLSCRSEYLDHVVGKNYIPTIEHFGLEESTEKAIRRYANKFDLDIPSFPLMNPELNNPLFLHLACEALSTLGNSRFNIRTAGLSTIFRAFLEAINIKLSAPQYCNYDPARNLVEETINQLVQFDMERFNYDDVKRITTAILPDRRWSEHLMRGLIDEGILNISGQNHVSFGFQRLGDFSRALTIASMPPTEVQSWLDSKGDQLWLSQGTVAALGILIPESHNLELPDFDISGIDEYQIRKYFLDSLTLREIASISTRTISILESCLDEDFVSDNAWEQLVRISCVPGHPLNANWLHSHLSQMELSVRDSSWSIWLHNKVGSDESTPVSILIDWAWPPENNLNTKSSNETNVLAGIALSWFLTTSDRRVRDNATKSLVSLGENYPKAFNTVLKRTLNSNDPYVVERLVAAACGIALRQPSSENINSLASILSDHLSNSWPTHLLIRDYLRRIFTLASGLGWKNGDEPASRSADWPTHATTHDEIEKLVDDPQSSYSLIWYSLTGMGDFGNKILASTLQDFDLEDPKETLEFCQRVIFDRVCALGWTSEKFGHIDGSLRRGRDQSPIERIGKKYQWIGFYELLGLLTDYYRLKPKSWEDSTKSYEYAEQLVSRDIDVTVLTRIPESEAKSHWFAPGTASFAAEPSSRYPKDLDCVPDPIDLLVTRDNDGQEWLTLLSFRSWKQENETLFPDLPTRDAWMHIHAYIVSNDSMKDLQKWAKGKDWFGKWMPSFSEPSNLLLGSYPYAPEWEDANGIIPDDDYPRSPVSLETHTKTLEELNKQLGYSFFDTDSSSITAPSEKNQDDRGLEQLRDFELAQSGALYLGLGTDIDHSFNRKVAGFVPSRLLFEELGLRHGNDFVWKDATGVAVLDPAPSRGGPQTLLLNRRLVKELQNSGFGLFWTVLVGHDQFGNSHTVADDYQWVTGSASYVLTDGKILRISARAEIRYRASEELTQISWALKETENPVD